MGFADAAAKKIDTMLQQALTAHAQGNIAGAIQILTQIIDIMPDHPDALNLRGTMYFLQGNFTDALTDQARAVSLDPGFVDFRNNYAVTLRKAGVLAEAEKQLSEALRLAPQDFKSNFNLGQLLYSDLNRYKDALPYLSLAVKLKPDHGSAQRLYASALLLLHEPAKALQHFLIAEQAGQNDTELLAAIASCLYVGGNYSKTQAYCQRILQKDPKSGKAHFLSGCVLADQGNHAAAIIALKKSLELEPDSFDARNKLLSSLLTNKELATAKTVLDYWTDKPELLAQPFVMIHQYNYYTGTGDFSALRQHPNILRLKDLETDPLFASGLSMIGLVMAEDDETSRQLYKYQRNWGKFWEKRSSGIKTKRKFLTARRPRTVGLLSADFRDHSVGKFLLPLIDQVDKSKIEFYGYSLLPGVGDRVHDYFQKQMGKFKDVSKKQPDEVASIIAEDDVDIIIDLNGMTMGGCSQAFASRCAPVQMTWLGYPFSTGLKDCDYMLVDAFLNPPSTECMSEKPLILGGSSYLCFGAAEPRPIGDLPYDRNGYITFGSLNNPYKLGTKTIDLWRAVLQAVPSARLLYIRPEFADATMRENIIQSIATDGVNADRLILKANYLPSHLDYYNEMDISLDTYPVTGGTTTMESLWMGVPVVSRHGTQIHQRVSYSIMNYAGLGNLCVDRDQYYVELAAHLTTEQGKLREWRKTLREHLMKTTLIDSRQFINAFTDAMLSV
ncbi:MAG: glycosyltransferase family 41 protein [Alphaproteobacteria bacterium]|nr:MAG: glycosyltransferase family 41 protein [Alphaproteobacteria bacterium]